MTAKEYNECVRLEADDVMRFAARTIGRRERAMTAEDAVQEAFAGLWRHRDEVERCKGKQYLLGAVYNQMLNMVGRDRLTLCDPERTLEETLCGADEAKRMETRQAIEVALEWLTPLQRAILQLKDVEGYSYREIGETLGVSENQVQVYLFRARVKMKRILSQNEI